MKTINGKVDIHDFLYFKERWGEPLLGMPCPMNEKGEIQPQTTLFALKGGVAGFVVHIKPVYYERLDGQWRPLSEVCDHHGNHKIVLKPDWDKKMSIRFLSWLIKRMELLEGEIFIPSPFKQTPVKITRGSIHFTSFGPFFPDPSPETTTTDGVAFQDINNQTWAAIHDAASATTTRTNLDPDFSQFFQTGNNASSWATLGRSYYLFDSSSLGSGATVTAATLSLFGTSKEDLATITPNIDIYTTTPASNTTIAVGDYSQIGTTSQTGSAIAYSSWSTTAYNDFAFNATGIGNVSKTGVSKFGARNAQYDAANSAPAYNAARVLSDVDNSSADHTGTTQDPKLAGTFTSGGGTTVTPRLLIMHAG